MQGRETLFFFSLEDKTKAKCQKLTGVRLGLKQRLFQSSEMLLEGHRCLETLVKVTFLDLSTHCALSGLLPLLITNLT